MKGKGRFKTVDIKGICFINFFIRVVNTAREMQLKVSEFVPNPIASKI